MISTVLRIVMGVFFLMLGSLSAVYAGSTMVANSRLTAYDGAAFDLFGISVDVAPEGYPALVGASQGTSSVNSGAAYLFTSLSGSGAKKLTPLDPTPGDDFGAAVALSDDKKTAVIGSPDAKVGNNSFQGAAYIFTSVNGWIQQAKLVAPDGKTESLFGCAVDISDNGNTVIVGSCSTPGVAGMPSVYMYIRQGTKWSLQKQFRGQDTAADDSFGSTVALSGDGNTALVGASMDHVGTRRDQGSAYVFVRSGSSWTQQAQLFAADGVEWDQFGNAVDLSDDGNTALVGASWKGAAYVFSRNGSSWIQEKKFTASDGGGSDRFGQSVALSNNGNIALVGAEFARAAYLYVHQDNEWVQTEKLGPGDPDAYGFGGAVAVADDGETVLVGADEMDVFGISSQGVVYVFRPYIPLNSLNFLLLKSAEK